MSIKKEEDLFAKGIFRNLKTGQKINTPLHAPLTPDDLGSQGYTPFTSKVENGGELFFQNIGGGQQYQEFVQRPKGWEESIKSGTPVKSEEAPINIDGVNYKMGSGGQLIKLDIPKTVDSDPGVFASNQRLTTPNFMTGLSPEDETRRQEALDAEIKAISDASLQEIKEIQRKGTAQIGQAKGFLSKIGALGRTVSGAPLDTNLGVLDQQNNLIKQAIQEEYQNRDNAIAAARRGSAEAAEKKVEQLNKLIQQNFDNALKLVQEDRLMASEERQNKLADLQVSKLSFEIDKANRDMKKENVKDALDTIKTMAESGIPLDQLSVGLINDMEAEANLPIGSFEAYYQSSFDAKQLANKENTMKVKKIEQDILNSVENVKIAKERLELSKKTESRLGYQYANDLANKGKIKISADDRNRIIGSGLSISDIDNIEKNLNNGYSLDEILNSGNLTDAQKTTIKNTMSGITPTQEVETEKEGEQFLSRDYISKLFTSDQLEQAAVDAGFGDLGEGMFNLKDVDVKKYLDYLDNLIAQYRNAGYSDKEILKMMQ